MKLSEIAEYVAERANRQFDIPFKLQMEDAVVNWRATLLTNTLQKDPSKKTYFNQSIIVPLIKTKLEDNDCIDNKKSPCIDEDNNIILKSKVEIPDTLKISINPFDYVGTSNGLVPFGWTTFATEPYLSTSKYTGKKERYTLLNNKIYVFNNRSLEYVRIDGVFSDPRKLYNFACSTTSDVCYNSNSEFPVDGRTAQMIIQFIMQVDLNIRVKDEMETEVKVNEK